MGVRMGARAVRADGRDGHPRGAGRGGPDGAALLAAGVPPLLQHALDAGRNRLREGRVPPAGADLQVLRSAKDRSRVVKSNPGASLVDLGDGVLAVEFHSKMNAIGGDAIAMLQQGAREAAQNFAALVIGNEAPHFSAGANLMLVLLEAQDENWDELDAMVRAFQQTVMMLRGCDVPVVVAPAGLALGGACELALHADRVQAAGETYMGLVEVGVGLIPAGGGTKEMAARAAERAPTAATDCRTSSTRSRPSASARHRRAGRTPCGWATCERWTASR